MTDWPKRAILDAIGERGATAREIADKVGIPLATLRVRLVAYQNRGHVHIARRLQGRGHPAVYKVGPA